MSFKVKGQIYIYTKYKGIYKLTNDKLKFIKSSSIVANSFVRAILPYNNNLIIFTWFDGAFIFDGKNFSKISTPIDNILIHNTYRAYEIKNKFFAFMLYDGGLLITDKKFQTLQFLTSPYPLKNDKIYRVFLDNQDNLWLCSDNGLASVFLFSPFTEFSYNYGFDNESTCFDALIYHNNLFVASASGVYFKQWNKNENKLSITPFKKIINSAGNIKTQQLDTINNLILAASNSGLYTIKQNINEKKDTIYEAQYILGKRGIKNFTQTHENKNVIVGISSVIYVFKKINNKWKFFKDFQNYRGKYIIEDNNGYFWISDLINGIKKIKFNQNFDSIIKSDFYIAKDSSLKGLPSEKNIRIFKIDSSVIFATQNGIYRFNNNTNSFYPDTKLNKLLGKDKYLTFFYEDSHKNYWYKKETYEKNVTNWSLVELLKTDTGYTKLSKPFAPFKNSIFSFTQIANNQYIIGNANGFIHYNASIKTPINKHFPAFIRSVKINNFDSIIFAGTFIGKDSNITIQQNPENIPKLKYKYNNLRFTFSGAFYKAPDKLKYSYFLQNNDSKWSDWTSENYKDYSNLKPGQYTFFVKAKNYYGIISSPAKFSFVIIPPFYMTKLAYLIYIILFGIIIWLIVLLYTRRLRKQKESLEELVKQRTKEIEKQKQEIEKINKDITDSIEYAKRIQTAMLPLESNIAIHLKDYFILFKPRDIVSGDFYWFSHKNNKTFIAAVDCTGHGVPGAFMSMIGAEILTTIVNNQEIDDAAQILELLNKYIRTALKQDATENQDGMDMALCVIDKKNNTLEFAGAKNPLLYIHNNQIFKIKGNRQSIGGFQFGDFKKHIIKYQSPTWFYIFSDGYADQFGGNPEKPEKFMVKRFKNLLLKIHQKPLEEQKNILDKEISNWMKNLRQTDDILVIGFKL
jgi:serine phosphatase RsbU (regulator of sigma subunit)